MVCEKSRKYFTIFRNFTKIGLVLIFHFPANSSIHAKRKTEPA